MNASLATNLMNQLNDASLLFNVKTEALTTASGIAVPNKKAIINASNDSVIGVASDSYKVVTNEAIFSGFTKSLEASGIDGTDAHIRVLSTPNRSRSIVDFIFPAVEINVPGDVSKTALSITALNSFDGTTRYSTKAGGLRMKCLNGQLLGSIVGSYSSPHTSGLDVEEGARRVISMIEQFNNARDYFGSMMKKAVSPDVAKSVMCQFLRIKQHDATENKRYIKLYDMHYTYKREMGDNAYALYNALSDWTTHVTPRNTESVAINAANNRRQFEKILTLDVFN